MCVYGRNAACLTSKSLLEKSPVVQKRSKPSWFVSLAASSWLHFLLLVTHVKIHSILRSEIKKEFVYKLNLFICLYYNKCFKLQYCISAVVVKAQSLLLFDCLKFFVELAFFSLHVQLNFITNRLYTHLLSYL